VTLAQTKCSIVTAARFSCVVVAAIVLVGIGSHLQTIAAGGAAKAAPAQKDGELYAEQPEEKFAPADARVPNTVRRARADDTIFKLSNPREGEVKSTKGGTRNAILVDWEIVRVGKFDGGELVVHTSDGQRANVRITFDKREHGTIELVVGGFMFKKKTTAQLPKDAEFYMVRTDARFGPKGPTFKVSNSVVLGKMTVATKARNWTPQEITAYQKGPPAYAQLNTNLDVGEDTAFVGASAGGNTLRYVDPSGMLLGLEYTLGEWAGEKCLGGLVPIYDRDQESVMPASKREVSKKGYAVAGAEVFAGKYVDGVKLIYAKLKTDAEKGDWTSAAPSNSLKIGGAGKVQSPFSTALDLKDSYTGSLLGYKGPTSQILVKDGRKVLGIYLRQGAILDGLAFVAEKK